MKILFACGGTGGHINPAIAIASTIRAKQPEAQILFAGNPKGMEAKLVPQAGFDFAPITIKGFQRRLTWFNVKYNISSVFYLTTASARSKRLIQKFGPDLVVGTGGYVSGPILRKAAQLGIRTVSHESNAFPGVTTKLLSRYVDEILLAVPEAKKYPGTPTARRSWLATRCGSRLSTPTGKRPERSSGWQTSCASSPLVAAREHTA